MTVALSWAHTRPRDGRKQRVWAWRAIQEQADEHVRSQREE